MGSEALGMVREGDVLAGKYRVEKVLGVGGMGVVVAAHHLALDTTVAIKFLRPEMLNNSEAVARFASEARSAVRIRSEYVARVFDVGTLETGAPYMVMEFLDGGDLATWLEQRGRLPIDQAIEFMLEVCLAVADAHGLGIVHRDLKPANFFCIRRTDGQLAIKVLDFGISKVTAGDASGRPMSVTRTNSVMGSPLYMSPEQLRSPKDVDAQTDIWSIGASLYELVSGKVPFHGDSIAELAVKLATESPPSLRTLRPDVPQGLEAVVLKCLQKDRARRYANVGELAIALLEFAPKRARFQVERISAIVRATGLANTEMSVPPSRQSMTEAESATIPPVGRTGFGLTRTKAGIAVATAATVAVVGGFMWLRAGPRVALTTPTGPTPTLETPTRTPPPPGVASAAPSEPPPSSPSTELGPTRASEPPQRAHEEPQHPAGHNLQVRSPVAPTRPSASVAAMAVVPSAVPSVSVQSTASCNPPFYFDQRHARVFKKECLH